MNEKDVVKNNLLSIRLAIVMEKNQKKFAEKIGIPQSQYNKYENQKSIPDLGTAIKITKSLNTLLKELKIDKSFDVLDIFDLVQ